MRIRKALILRKSQKARVSNLFKLNSPEPEEWDALDGKNEGTV